MKAYFVVFLLLSINKPVKVRTSRPRGDSQSVMVVTQQVPVPRISPSPVLPNTIGFVWRHAY